MADFLDSPTKKSFLVAAIPLTTIGLLKGLESCARGTAYRPCLISSPLSFLIAFIGIGIFSAVLGIIFGKLVYPIVSKLFSPDREILQQNHRVKALFFPVLVISYIFFQSYLQRCYITSAGGKSCTSAIESLYMAASELQHFTLTHGLEYVNLSLASRYVSLSLSIFTIVATIAALVTMFLANALYPRISHRNVVRKLASKFSSIYSSPYRKIAVVVIAFVAGLAYSGGSGLTSVENPDVCTPAQAVDDVSFKSTSLGNSHNVTVVVGDPYHIDNLYLRETSTGLSQEIRFYGSMVKSKARIYTHLPNGTRQVEVRNLSSTAIQQVHGRIPPDSPVLNITLTDLSPGDRVIAKVGAIDSFSREDCEKHPYPVGSYEVKEDF